MKNQDKIEIKTIQSVDKNDFIGLYKDAGWWKPEYEQSTEFITILVKNSTCFVGAFKNKRMIGMGRAISDGVSDAFIQDVAVLHEYRRQGIGGEIVKSLLRHLKAKGVDWIGLIGKPGTQHFYQNLGFNALEGHVPMKLKD